MRSRRGIPRRPPSGCRSSRAACAAQRTVSYWAVERTQGKRGVAEQLQKCSDEARRERGRSTQQLTRPRTARGRRLPRPWPGARPARRRRRSTPCRRPRCPCAGSGRTACRPAAKRRGGRARRVSALLGSGWGCLWLWDGLSSAQLGARASSTRAQRRLRPHLHGHGLGHAQAQIVHTQRHGKGFVGHGVSWRWQTKLAVPGSSRGAFARSI